ncbi:uncharacterized protein LOC113557950 [Rhopalosiphum maidis]|uniref:uncharacterized protein LOC113557950 n=1 Tax=Rhopalosiphum maidis TaxID=43146 RepID=UPI000EFFA524|nr:uncharacterized protein LOC113557950 [Rhopalosiphum maidis]
MTNYSLIEIKLRRFIYLGEKTSIYVPSTHQKQFWKNKNSQDNKITGLNLIGDIIKKNKTEDINSIVPIISKIAKEKKVQNYEHLIYLLAVCAKFNRENCQKMITDAYAIVKTICMDGLTLLMFYKFCSIAAKLLYENGYISTKSSGLGQGTRKAIQKWYLSREPLETIKAIMKHKTYRGVSHKQIMNTIHLRSDDPSHGIYISYILHGIERIKKVFEQTLIIEDNDSQEQKLSKTLQLCVYNYIKRVHRLHNSTNNKLTNDLKWNNVGKDYEIVVSKMLTNPKVLTTFVKQLSLRTLLDNTYSFSQHCLFQNLMGNEGCIEFILRFNNHKALQESEIHPIESYLEYLRYVRSGPVIYAMNQKKDSQQNMLFDTNGKECSNNIGVVKKNYEKWIQLTKIEKGQRKFCKSHIYFMKPIPTPSSQLSQFLSTDLVKMTLNNLNPSDHRLLIAYDSRIYYTNTVNCYYMHVKFLKVFEAITLIIQSIVYQNRLKVDNKPTICALSSSLKFRTIYVDHEQALTVTSLENHLFGPSPKKQKNNARVRNIKPLSTLHWSKDRNQMYDVFLFMGTHKMDLKSIRKVKANYEAYFSNSKIKIIVCCLNGNHVERVNLSRDGLLFISGFDKHVGKIIELFINNNF